MMSSSAPLTTSTVAPAKGVGVSKQNDEHQQSGTISAIRSTTMTATTTTTRSSLPPPPFYYPSHGSIRQATTANHGAPGPSPRQQQPQPQQRQPLSPPPAVLPPTPPSLQQNTVRRSTIMIPGAPSIGSIGSSNTSTQRRRVAGPGVTSHHRTRRTVTVGTGTEPSLLQEEHKERQEHNNEVSSLLKGHSIKSPSLMLRASRQHEQEKLRQQRRQRQREQQRLDRKRQSIMNRILKNIQNRCCIKNKLCNCGRSRSSANNLMIIISIGLWFGLGVCSIASTKYLLSTVKVPPMILSVQQFFIGGTFLHILLQLSGSEINNNNGASTSSVLFSQTTSPANSNNRLRQQSLQQQYTSSSFSSRIIHYVSTIVSALCASFTSKYRHRRSKLRDDTTSSNNTTVTLVELFYVAFYFGLGFVLTNIAFEQTPAPLVETIKAAEPFTSAIVATTNGVDTISSEESFTLVGIVSGVLLSTFGSDSSTSNIGKIDGTTIAATSTTTTTTTASSIMTNIGWVMLSNICFSLRGLHQKLLRNTLWGDSTQLSDLYLQYHVQWISFGIFIIPTCLFSLPSTLWKLLTVTSSQTTSITVSQYIGLSFMNAIAFAGYNLASTFVLSRLSVVHHAALNCIRRIFAILVTSIIFHNVLTKLSIVGILVSVISFMCYTHYKLLRSSNNKHHQAAVVVSSLLPMSVHK